MNTCWHDVLEPVVGITERELTVLLYHECRTCGTEFWCDDCEWLATHVVAHQFWTYRIDVPCPQHSGAVVSEWHARTNETYKRS